MMRLAGAVPRLDHPIVEVGTVEGGRASTFWTVPHLGDEALREALEDALRARGAWAADGRYRIDAHIARESLYGGSIPNPDSGAELGIDYTVTDRQDSTWVWRTSVQSVHWVRQAEVFVGLERARRAIEGAAAKNLADMLDRLLPELDRRARSQRTASFSLRCSPLA